jgi:hypothetical protein
MGRECTELQRGKAGQQIGIVIQFPQWTRRVIPVCEAERSDSHPGIILHVLLEIAQKRRCIQDSGGVAFQRSGFHFHEKRFCSNRNISWSYRLQHLGCFFAGVCRVRVHKQCLLSLPQQFRIGG